MTVTATPTRNDVENATKVLAKAALLDPRISAGDEGTILAWAEVLAPTNLTASDLLAALTAHYGTSSERIMPAELIRLARTRRRDRVDREIGSDCTPPAEQLQLPAATIEARKQALAAAAAKIGASHAADGPSTFKSTPRPPRIDSPATIAAKVARARDGWTPPPGWTADHPAGDVDAEIGCDWHDDSDGRHCMLAANHLGPHHPSKATR